MADVLDERIHFVHEPARMDPGTCLNWMLERAKGEHFSYIHTDNRLLPSFVSSHRKALAVHPLALAVCDYWEITEVGQRRKIRRRQDPFPLERLFSVDTIGVPFAATTELARRLGGFSTTDLADDVLFVLRADPLGPRVHIRQPQMEYRVHGGSRFLSSGLGRVQQAIFRSVVQAYGERLQSPEVLQNPFLGGDVRAQRHVARASRMAMVRAGRLMTGNPAGQLWIQGTGPDSFWLAWGCFQLGVPVAGFVDGVAGSLLGLPVQGSQPEGATLLRPRARRGFAESLGWLMHGLPPLDHLLKRLPGDVMCGLVAPYLAGAPRPEPLYLRGGGAMAAYLAYGAEVLGGVRVSGFLDLGSETTWPPLQVASGSPDPSNIWVIPGAKGAGRVWKA
jgi:hypothetical protein